MSAAQASLLIWGLEILLLTATLLLPVLLAMRQGPGIRGRRAPALALHQAQRDSLARDQADGLLDDTEHASARLEIDRRLLAEAARPDAQMRPRHSPAIGSALLLLAPVPLLAIGLYALGGHPRLPAQPLGLRAGEGQDKQREDDQLIAALRQGLVGQDPASAQTRQGYLLLGQVEATRGHWAQAATAWRTALAQGFDPTLAVQAAEAQTRADGSVSVQSASLFRRALDAAPADAPWRQMAEQRVAQSEAH